jgi:hypothetical protein
VLSDLVTRPDVGIAEITAYLDDLDDATRAGEAASLGRAAQRLLYEKAAHAPPIDTEHFLDGAGPLVEVIHEGRNTLPVPPRLRRFEKRFCRPAEDGHARLFGYNQARVNRWIGPGYFVAVPTAGRPAWESRGAIVIDYFQVPDGEVAAGWPPVIGNRQGLQRFVYGGTRDFMRRVSRHVSIGAAYKGERPLDHYFVLCRRA